MGGESQRASLKRFRAILYAPLTGKPSYLPPIMILIANVCKKTRRRVGPYWRRKQPIAYRNFMQFSIYKGAIDFSKR
jgi:hypothetical protein